MGESCGICFLKISSGTFAAVDSCHALFDVFAHELAEPVQFKVGFGPGWAREGFVGHRRRRVPLCEDDVIWVAELFVPGLLDGGQARGARAPLSHSLHNVFREGVEPESTV